MDMTLHFQDYTGQKIPDGEFLVAITSHYHDKSINRMVVAHAMEGEFQFLHDEEIHMFAELPKYSRTRSEYTTTSAEAVNIPTTGYIEVEDPGEYEWAVVDMGTVTETYRTTNTVAYTAA